MTAKKNKIVFLLLFIFVLLGACSQTTDTTKVTVTDSKQVENQVSEKPISKSTDSQKSISQNHSQNQSTNKLPSSLPKGLIAATIVKNVDGDTVHVSINGKDEDIRLLLIDTPETHKPGTPVEPFGPEASAYAEKELSTGTKVMLEEGVKGHERDKYGRLLAYIFLSNGKMYNEEVVKKGLARVAYIYEPNTNHLSALRKDESYAKQHKLGIWSIPGYVTDSGYNIGSKSNSTNTNGTHSSQSSSHSQSSLNNSFENNPADDKESNTSCKGKIKGNANSKIYHVPGGEYYDRTKDNIVWFCTEADAQKAGYRKSQR